MASAVLEAAMTSTTTTAITFRLLYVQHGGFRNYASACEFPSLIHKLLLVYEAETFREDGGGGGCVCTSEQEQQQSQQQQPQRRITPCT
jgi:hypothetical protein